MASARDFLYAKNRPNGWPAQNVVVIRYVRDPAGDGYTARFSPGNDRAYFRRLVFGRGPGTMADYMKEMSRSGVFFKDDAGVFVTRKVYRVPKGNGRQMRRNALLAAAEEIDFRKYRRPGARTLTTSDVAVVMIGAGPGGGQVNSTDPATIDIPGQLPVRLRVAAFGEMASLDLMVHEFMHLFGAVDLYSHPENWNTPASLMGASGRRSHADAMHKLLNGWVKPQLFDVNAGIPRRGRLLAQTVGERREGEGDPILIFDSRRGTREFFLLEYRTPSAASARAGNYETGLDKERGVAIWHVTTKNRALHRRDGFIVPSGNQLRTKTLRGDDRLAGSGWSGLKPIVAGDSGVLYGVKPDASLVWYRHSGWETGTKRWARSRETVLDVGSGWRSGWGAFHKVVSGRDGVLYGIKPDGSLVWYRHEGWETGAKTWANRGVQRVLIDGGRWADFEHVVCAGEGILYAVKSDGSLVWYRHQGWRTGQRRWANRGREIVLSRRGRWAEFVHLLSGGEGTLYGIKRDGTLVWYRHEGWRNGIKQWANRGREVVLASAGWNGFLEVIAGEQGCLYAVKPDGALVWYRHLGWRDGTKRWANRAAEKELTSGGDGRYIDWGRNGRLETKPLRGDEIVRAWPINLYASPDGALGYKTSFWRAEHGRFRLRWVDGRDARLSVEVLPAAANADHVEVQLRPGRP